MPEDPTQSARDAMVDLVAARGVVDAAVLRAMRRFPRHDLVPREERVAAYADRPLPIDFGQTISQPYIVAVMTAEARVRPGDTVLEIGTGSGYQAAILALCGARVFSIEIVEPLATRAREDLRRLESRFPELATVQIKAGDGYAGWPEEAPFDAIVVTAAPEVVPPALLQQLQVGGRLVIPVGTQGGGQMLQVHERTKTGIVVKRVFGVRFVPMTGAALQAPPDGKASDE